MHQKTASSVLFPLSRSSFPHSFTHCIHSFLQHQSCWQRVCSSILISHSHRTPATRQDGQLPRGCHHPLSFPRFHDRTNIPSNDFTATRQFPFLNISDKTFSAVKRRRLVKRARLARLTSCVGRDPAPEVPRPLLMCHVNIDVPDPLPGLPGPCSKSTSHAACAR
ncbi:uncharacterized protein B0I36DRAFT_57275 [Microdochium trichocladiopsis]|uniref:Uncharacterized protein n=1 Tax=Microdochium trichocladiopsis TaxID=1682393 RepID=A0A9P9BHC6_9PEZI|nr:uncharacterized protein B0I36DRAFT_57275 [Microdochium trichocladiopsis]KAH7010576.1 hypothetical protein B0I36DRAFT_57275 [Microdochium trichocladiopsis]